MHGLPPVFWRWVLHTLMVKGAPAWWSRGQGRLQDMARRRALRCHVGTPARASVVLLADGGAWVGDCPSRVILVTQARCAPLARRPGGCVVSRRRPHRHLRRRRRLRHRHPHRCCCHGCRGGCHHRCGRRRGGGGCRCCANHCHGASRRRQNPSWGPQKCRHCGAHRGVWARHVCGRRTWSTTRSAPEPAGRSRLQGK